MEVEVKLRLPNLENYQKVITLLKPFHLQIHNQKNYFFDSANGALSSRRAVLRLRFYENANKCVVSLKAKAVLVDGVSRVEEDEEELDFSGGRECLSEPGRVGDLDSRVVRRAKEEFGVGGTEFKMLGGFGNVRNVYEWKGLKIEVDETSFAFGTLYEIECESSEPEEAKRLIEEYLKENGVEYSYSEKSKFAIFRAGKLPLYGA